MDVKTAEILRAASLALNESLSLDVVLDALLDFLGRLIPYDSADVLLLDGQRFVVRATRGYERWTDPALIRGLVLETERFPILAEMLAARSSIVVPDAHAHSTWVRSAASGVIRCVIT